MTPLFTLPHIWDGGLFELALRLGPPDDLRLQTAFEAVWAHEDLEGVYLKRDVEL